MVGASADSMLVTDLVNVRYLCGFTGSNGSLAVTPDSASLITDGRYVDQAADEAPDILVVSGRATAPTALRLLRDQGSQTVAIEADHVSVALFRTLEDGFCTEGTDAGSSNTTEFETAPGMLRLVSTTGLVEQLRRRKDPGELALIRRACQIICDVFDQLLPEIGPGMTERNIARQLQWLVHEAGADEIAFETIVAAGPNSAIPHHSPTDRPLMVGDLLKIDAGAKFHGYHSDMTRTYVVAAEPTQQQADLHAAVAAAAGAARDLVAIGTPVAAADAAARQVLAGAGLNDRYTHGLGHGVGLQIHEAPMLGRDLPDTMAVGDVLTIEPGAYVPGFGGVRVEDTLAVTEAGTECLTTVARVLIRLG